VKHTADDHPDKENILAALEQTKSVAIWINQQITDMDNRTKLTEIQKNIRNPNPKDCKVPVLVQPGRFYVTEGKLSLVPNDFGANVDSDGKMEREEELYAYLFSDLFLVCKKMLPSSVQHGISVKKQSENEKPLDFYEFHLFLHKAPVVWVIDCKLLNLFQVIGKRTYTLRADSKQETERWVSTFKHTMKELIENPQYALTSRTWAVSEVEHPLIQDKLITVVQAVFKGVRARKRAAFLKQRRQTRMDRGISSDVDKTKILQLLQVTNEDLQRNQTIEDRNIERRRTVIQQQKHERVTSRTATIIHNQDIRVQQLQQRSESFISNKSIRRPRGFSKMAPSPLPKLDTIRFRESFRSPQSPYAASPEPARFLTVEEELGEIDLATLYPASDYWIGELNIDKELEILNARANSDNLNVGKTTVRLAYAANQEDAIVFETGLEEPDLTNVVPSMDYLEEEFVYVDTTPKTPSKTQQTTVSPQPVVPVVIEKTVPTSVTPIVADETPSTAVITDTPEEVQSVVEEPVTVPSISDSVLPVVEPEPAVEKVPDQVEVAKKDIVEKISAEPIEVQQEQIEVKQQEPEAVQLQQQEEPMTQEVEQKKEETIEVTSLKQASDTTQQPQPQPAEEEPIVVSQQQPPAEEPIVQKVVTQSQEPLSQSQQQLVETVQQVAEQPVSEDNDLPALQRELNRLDVSAERFQKDMDRRKLDLNQFEPEIAVKLVEKFKNNEVAMDKFKTEFNSASPQDQEVLLANRKKAQKELEDMVMTMKKQLNPKSKTPVRTRVTPSAQTQKLLQPQAKSVPTKPVVQEQPKVEPTPVIAITEEKPATVVTKQTQAQEPVDENKPKEQQSEPVSNVTSVKQEKPQIVQPNLRPVKTSPRKESSSTEEPIPVRDSDFAFANLLGRFKNQEESVTKTDGAPQRKKSFGPQQPVNKPPVEEQSQKSETLSRLAQIRLRQEAAEKEAAEKLQRQQEEQEKQQNESESIEDNQKQIETVQPESEVQQEDQKKQQDNLEEQALLEQKKKEEEDRTRIELEKQEQERVQREKEEQERLEQIRLEEERKEQLRVERLQGEEEARLEQVQENLQKEREEERIRLEQENLQKEREEQDRLEQIRIQQEKEHEETERLEREEQERLEQAKRDEEERLAREKQQQLEQERLEQERMQREREEQERLEQIRIQQEKEREEKDRLEREEQERLKIQQEEQSRKEAEAVEQSTDSSVTDTENTDTDKQGSPTIAYRNNAKPSTGKTAAPATSTGSAQRARFKDKKKDFYGKLRSPSVKGDIHNK
jgi:hypothetical protein